MDANGHEEGSDSRPLVSIRDSFWLALRSAVILKEMRIADRGLRNRNAEDVASDLETGVWLVR
jgi:hypothetical protein